MLRRTLCSKPCAFVVLTVAVVATGELPQEPRERLNDSDLEKKERDSSGSIRVDGSDPWDSLRAMNSDTLGTRHHG